MKFTLLLSWILVLGTGNLFAGYILTYHLDHYSNEGVKTSRCVETDYIESDKMRLETNCQDPDAHSSSTVSIFRGDEHLIWEIEPAAHSYTEMSRSDVEKKRKSFEDALQSTGRHSYKPTIKTEKVKNWTCTIYQHVFHGNLSDEFCIADGDAVFKGAGDAEASKRRLQEALDPLLFDPEEQNQLADLAMGKSRFTLKQVNILLDEPASVLEFSEGHSASVPALMFELPKDYSRKQTAL